MRVQGSGGNERGRCGGGAKYSRCRSQYRYSKERLACIRFTNIENGHRVKRCMTAPALLNRGRVENLPYMFDQKNTFQEFV